MITIQVSFHLHKEIIITSRILSIFLNYLFCSPKEFPGVQPPREEEVQEEPDDNVEAQQAEIENDNPVDDMIEFFQSIDRSNFDNDEEEGLGIILDRINNDSEEARRAGAPDLLTAAKSDIRKK